eukprot:1146901-Pelagomonas_calceolata.AAC.1
MAQGPIVPSALTPLFLLMLRRCEVGGQHGIGAHSAICIDPTIPAPAQNVRREVGGQHGIRAHSAICIDPTIPADAQKV